MSKIPCRNCITLPICKIIQARKNKNHHVNLELKYRCSLLKDFLNTWREYNKVGKYLDKPFGKNNEKNSM